MIKELLSPKQVAQALGVSESSLKRWCDQGLIATIRTGGGHRRLALPDVLRFIRDGEHRLVSPEALGLPPVREISERCLERARDLLAQALLDGDEPLSRRIVFDLYLAKHSLSSICDEVVAAAFCEIGERWSCQQAEVYQERRACEIMLRMLHSLRETQHGMAPEWRAIGGTPEGDSYLIPNAMVELVLRETGWSAMSLGASIPFESYAAAVRAHRPRLVWLSVSHIPDLEAFVAGYQRLYEVAQTHRTAIVVGGQALTNVIRQRIRYASYCDTVRHLEEFARTMRSLGGGGT
jgi:excisionase family DNA binding protein